jgi:hypothetical protein
MAIAPPTNLVATASSSLLAAPTITTTNLPGAALGQVYTGTVVATGGKSPYSWSINSGALPPGLVLQTPLTTSVNIAGTPTAVGVYTFQLLCTDAQQQTAQVALTMEHPQ